MIDLFPAGAQFTQRCFRSTFQQASAMPANLHRHPPEYEPEGDNQSDDERHVSKSQRKRDVEALQNMGTELLELSPGRLRKMDLPEDLLAALLECQRITSNGALRRQRQFIGKLMRNVDAGQIAAQLASIKGESDAVKAKFHALENWRARLLEDADALTHWMTRHPGSDAQQLRQLIRNARREAELGKPPKSSRELFRVLREISADGEIPSGSTDDDS